MVAPSRCISAVHEKALGPDHPAVAEDPLVIRGAVQDEREDGRAEPLVQRALAIRERALGPDHPDVATSLQSLATLYWATSRLPEAVLAHAAAGEDVRERTLGCSLPPAPSAQKLAYLDTIHAELDGTLVRRGPGASHLALTTLLRL